MWPIVSHKGHINNAAPSEHRRDLDASIGNMRRTGRAFARRSVSYEETVDVQFGSSAKRIVDPLKIPFYRLLDDS